MANLTQNPSFEAVSGSTPVGWMVNNWGDTGAINQSDSTVAHTGTRSAMIIKSAAGAASFMQRNVPIVPGTTYTYSTYVSAQNLAPDAGAVQTIVNCYDASRTQMVGQFRNYANISGTYSWQPFSDTFIAPAGAVLADITLASYSPSGTIWFDDAFLGTSEPGLDTSMIIPIIAVIGLGALGYYLYKRKK